MKKDSDPSKDISFAGIWPSIRPGDWRIRYNEEIEQLIEGKSIVKFIKAQRIRWMGYVERMRYQNGRLKGGYLKEEERENLRVDGWTNYSVTWARWE